jgi:hypothetical protein
MYKDSYHTVESFRKEFGEPDVIKIRKIFTNIHDCIIYENRVLIKLNVRKNDRFINRSSLISNPTNPGMVYTRTSTDNKNFGYVKIDDKRLESGELINLFGGPIGKISRQKMSETKHREDQSGISSIHRSRIKRHIQKSKKDINGITGYEHTTAKAVITRKLIGVDGLTTDERSALKTKETRSVIGEDGSSSYTRAAEKTKAKNNSKDETGLTGYQRLNLKMKATRSVVGEDGLNSFQRASIKIIASQNIIGEDGLTVLQRSAIKRTQTSRIKNTTYDVYHITSGLYRSNLLGVEITRIHSNLISKRSKDNYLGFHKNGYSRLKTTNQLHLYGLYIVKRDKNEYK